MINPRTVAAFAHDLGAVAAAWLLAFWLRFNFDIPANFLAAAVLALGWVLPLFALLFHAFGLYRGLWRFASLSDLQHIVAAVTAGALVVSAVAMAGQVDFLPRSVLVLHPLLLALVMGGSRFAYRSWKEHRLYGPARLRGQPVLVLGTGPAADSLLRELARCGQWYPVAVIDDSGMAIGRRLHGLPVFGPVGALAGIAARFEVRHLIMAMPEAPAALRRQAAEVAAGAGLALLTVPSYVDLLAGRFSVSQIRQVQLEDLLGRKTVSLDQAELGQLIAGRVVLVSGAGGSIGAELCRQIAQLGPRRLVFVEQSEFALYRIQEAFARDHPALSCGSWLGDVQDAGRMLEVFAAEMPEIVFHAAACKQVPLMEADNAWLAVRTNAQGTLTLLRAAQSAGVARFVLVSTDKAVNPTSVMGASKRLAERICAALYSEGGMSVVTVRFGNVLGSHGSVIPKFREQIARGGPVTVTHPDMVRYFMTIPEAVQLVLHAAHIGRGGEIFVLDMGEPVRIADLARDMIRLSGFTEAEIGIEYTGLRPGEKLFEELIADDETTLPTPHPKLRVAKSRDTLDGAQYAALLAWLAQPVCPAAAVKRGLKAFVPEYSADF